MKPNYNIKPQKVGKLVLLFSLLISMLLGNKPGQAADGPNDRTGWFWSSQIIDNLASFDFAQVHDEPGSAWVVAQFEPSSTYKFTEAYSSIDVITEKRLTTPVWGHVSQRNGVLHVLAALTGDPTKRSWHYEMNLPNGSGAEGRPNPHPFFDYHPMLNGNTGVFRLNLNAPEDPTQYPPVSLIPSEWQQYVVPAFHFYQSHTGFFDAKTVGRHEKQLVRLLSDPNPFVAISACRTLAQGGLLSHKIAGGPIVHSSTKIQAVFWVLMLTYQTQDSAKNPAMGEIAARIDAARSGADLRGIVWGALAASVDNVPDSVIETANTLTDKARSRYASLVAAKKGDPEVAKIFDQLSQ